MLNFVVCLPIWIRKGRDKGKFYLPLCTRRRRQGLREESLLWLGILAFVGLGQFSQFPEPSAGSGVSATPQRSRPGHQMLQRRKLVSLHLPDHAGGRAPRGGEAHLRPKFSPVAAEAQGHLLCLHLLERPTSPRSTGPRLDPSAGTSR